MEIYMVFELLVLFYEKDVLELYILVEMFDFYYGKYYVIYVIKLNGLIEGIDLVLKSLEEIVKFFEGGVFNNVV